MSIYLRAKRLFSPYRSLHIPAFGDNLWWAPKQCWCQITKVYNDGSLIFQGGPLITRPSGKVVPQWTVSVNMTDCRWTNNSYWVVGEGVTPNNVANIIHPIPVVANLSGN